MPNWCYSQYIATGDKEQLKKLHSVMDELEGLKDPGLHENGFGKTWLGNLVIKLGGDWEKVFCRGYWDNLLLHEDCTVSFSVESAWGELNEVREFIEKSSPVLSSISNAKNQEWGFIRQTTIPDNTFRNGIICGSKMETQSITPPSKPLLKRLRKSQAQRT